MLVKSKNKLAVVLLVFILALIPFNEVFASDFNWAVLGNIFYFTADNGPGNPAPIIPSLGFSASWQLLNNLRLELTEDIYIAHYEYDFNLGYPIAIGLENRSAFVLGFLTGVQATGVFPVGNSTLRIFGGPAADFRVIIMAFGLKHPSDHQGDDRDAQKQTDAVRNFFWSKGRWFMPVAGFGFDFPINEGFKLGFDLRTWFPVYKLWADDNTPAIDGWRFGISFRITPR